jgi:hypothetical protein
MAAGVHKEFLVVRAVTLHFIGFIMHTLALINLYL